MSSPPSLKMLATMALGPDDAGVLSGEDWKVRQMLQEEERSALIKGDPSVLVNCTLVKLKRELLNEDLSKNISF